MCSYQLPLKLQVLCSQPPLPQNVPCSWKWTVTDTIRGLTPSLLLAGLSSCLTSPAIQNCRCLSYSIIK